MDTETLIEMKKKLPITLFKKLIITLGIVFSTLATMAAWVENIPTTVKNPDGTSIDCFASGDEFFNYLHDKAGFTIIQNNDGYYYYAVSSGDTLIASSYRVGIADPAKNDLAPFASISDQEYQRRKDEMFKTIDDSDTEKIGHSGVLNNLAIYIRFSDDTEFTTPRSTFDNRMNQDANPSVMHYFQEVSYGKITVQSHHFPESGMDVNISYQDPYPRSYFQPYNSTTNPNGYTASKRTSREHQLLHRAVSAVSSAIPSSINIDNDNDGRVDNVCFIIKGGNGAWSSILWAHRWALYTTTTQINGKRVWDYTFQPETQATVQILNHELFHTFGAPDLYRYSNNSITPVGPWDLMHSGSGHMNAFLKWKYTNQTWIENIPTISEPGTYTLNPLTSSENNAYRINSPNSSSEFFIVEYRKKTAGTYDASLPGSGLLIYKINTLAGNGNANGPPDEVYLYRPNGTLTLNGIASLANYSSSTGRTEINDSTNPSSFLSDGSAGGLDISNISDAGTTISFDLMGGSSVSWEITLEASPEHGGTFTGQGNYNQGNTVTLNAAAAQNFSFENWTENGTVVSSQPNYSFTANNNRHLVANFVSATPVYSISLEANPENGGTLTGAGIYAEGETITLDAISNDGYDFINWTENGSIVSTNAQYMFQLLEDRNLTANFQAAQPTVHLISLTANPAEGGTISGNGEYSNGQTATVSASAASGYSFVNWTENGSVVSSQTSYSFTVTEDRALTANFLLNSHTLTLNADPAIGGTVSGGGNYGFGQTATVAAVPFTDYRFVHWEENGAMISTQIIQNIEIYSNREITAIFEPITNSVKIDAHSWPTGFAFINGAGIYDENDTVKLKAVPVDNSFTFLGWEEDGVIISQQNSMEFSATQDRFIVARFEHQPKQFDIIAHHEETHEIEVTGTGTYSEGENATLEIKTPEHIKFIGWRNSSGQITSRSNPYTFAVTRNMSLVAVTRNDETLLVPADLVSVFPNPGNGDFKIKVEQAWKLEIRNSSGFLIWEQEIDAGITEINLNQWPTGMYIINLQNNRMMKTEKIIIN